MSTEFEPPDHARREDSPAHRIDAACDRFERLWRQGGKPRIEEFVDAAAESDRAPLLRELIDLEVELRECGGEHPEPSEYRARFPGDPCVVEEALAKSELRAGSGHPRNNTSPQDASRNLLPGLLPVQNDFTDRDALLRALTSWVGNPEVSMGHSTSAGTRFRIVRPHAKGGLGEVFVALDTELNRDVAVKEIQDDFADDPHYRARFKFEAEVTGGLEHPGIVPVYGLGHTADGRPYYAMRFIKGHSLKDAILRFHEAEKQPGRDPGQSTLELRELLGRFIDVCDAVAYAHSRNVLHRDLKPGNIMLGKYGETLVVDWGLAKALDEPETEGRIERSELPLKPQSGSALEPTLSGSVVGTPAYMSPEQVDPRFGTLGVRSDAYCLGATLYHLLTGHAPCEAEDRGHIYQKVLAGEIPPPRSLNSRVAPALEAICLKAIARQPVDRYDSAEALKRDIERWLADEPVTAWREPFTIRVRRWARHNRTKVTAAAAALLAGAIGLAAVAVVQANANGVLRKEKKATQDALELSEESRKRAEAVLTFLKDDVLAAARPEGESGGLGVDVTVRKAVTVAESKIGRAFRNQPVVEAELRETLGVTYFYLGEPSLAIPQFERALELFRTNLGPDHPTTLAGQSKLAEAYRIGGRTDDAIRICDATLKRQELILGPDHPSALSTRNNLALTFQGAGRTAEAIKMHEANLPLQESKLGRDHPDTLTSRNNLALAYHANGRAGDAIKMHEANLLLQESKLGRDHPVTLTSRNNLAGAYEAAGRIDDAVAMLETNLKHRTSKLGADHPDTIGSRNNLAALYRAAGRVSEITQMFETSLKQYEVTLGPDHPSTLTLRNNLAVSYHDSNRVPEAIALLESNLKHRESKLGHDHPDTLTSRGNLASMYRLAGRVEDAITMHEANLKQLELKCGPDHPDTLFGRHNLASAYFYAGRFDRSLPLFEITLKQRESKLGFNHPDTLSTQGNLGINYRDVGRLEEGIRLMKQALTRARQRYGAIPPQLGFVETQLAIAYDRADRFDEAEPLYRSVLQKARQRFQPSDPRTTGPMIQLGANLIDQRKFAEAEAVLGECFPLRQKFQPDDWGTFYTESLLGASLMGQGKYAAAEPLILAGYEGMKARSARISAAAKPRLAEAANRVVHLYDEWGKTIPANQWKEKLGLADLPADVFAHP